MLGISWSQWKHAMAHFAHAKSIHIPAGFTVSSEKCGAPCHVLLKRIQAHSGMAQDGILGPRTANLLRPWFPTHDARLRELEVCAWGVKNNAAIYYAQLRPMRVSDCTLPITEDCSKYATFGCYWADLPDPNGLHYSGEGNTETMYNHLPRISLSEAHAGDLVIFGGAVIHPLSHVVVLAEHGKADPDVYSHGFDGGPLRLPLSVETPYHDGLPRTVHKVI